MAMPEATMYKNDFLEALEYEVWLPRETRLVETKTISESVNQLSYAQLRFGVFIPYQ
jgi:hypothetical protein